MTAIWASDDYADTDHDDVFDGTIVEPVVDSGRAGARPHDAIEVGRGRLMITAAVFALAFGVVGARLVDIAALGGSIDVRPVAVAASAPATERAELVDANGMLLATSLPTASVFADPEAVIDPDAAALRLASVLPDIEVGATRDLLASDRRFVWIERNLTPQQVYEVNRLGLPGIGFQEEEQRYYPAGNLASHVVGYADVDGNGLAGVERALNDTLNEGGEPLRLSLDLRVQQIVREELAAAIEEFSAIGGVGVVMRADTAEVVSLVSLPDYDPYDAGAIPPEALFNRGTLGVYEMGSGFKILNTAIALETGVATLRDYFDASRPLSIGGFQIRDYHGQWRALSVPEIFMYSSNIGSALMALEFGPDLQRDYLGRLGMLERPPIELGEVASPLVPSNWRQTETATIAFGHGIAVSPVQLVAAISAVVSDGIYRAPTIIAREPGERGDGVRVFSPETVDAIRRLMRLVVTEGTGSNADAEGYLVGGKTGTAEKPGRGGYQEDALLSSFIGAFPMNSPEYVIFVLLDEPHGTERTHGYATGGWVAAPTVRRIVERLGPLEGIAPIDETDPEIVNAISLAPLVGGEAFVPTRN
ncbi:MAG: penicillin-binding protein 2 [Azospirillaceae bacterium]